jgi:glycosyltransferase involved in cell wall biosynthesis
MRVGIDAHMVGSHETGNETYVRGLVDGFMARAAGDLELVVFNVGTPWSPPATHVRFQRLLSGNPYLRLGFELPLRSAGQHLDVLHMTYAAPLWSAAPLVLTVHDICYATNPEWFSERDLRVLRANVPRSVRQAAHVITDSQSARDQIIETLGVAESKITSIPIGPGPGAEPIADGPAQQELAAIGLEPKRPYLLTVGNLQPRKNLVRLLQAFKILVGARGHDVDLLVVGPKHYRADETIAAAGEVAERVHFTGYVTDRQLAACYHCCQAFVFPSLYEGFGLPALEAMSQGAPIACSDAGSLPEVCGDAALFFDPLSVEAIADAVGRLLDDSELRQRLSGAATARARDFSWSKTADQTVEAYRKAASI